MPRSFDMKSLAAETKANFWKVPNPCYPHLIHKNEYVNSTVKVENGVGMIITLCPEHAKEMKGLDGDNQSQNVYTVIQPNEVVEMQLFPKPAAP